MSKHWYFYFGIVIGLMVSGLAALLVKNASSVALVTLCVSVPWGLVLTGYALGGAPSVRDGNDSSDATGVSSTKREP